ncbi:MAG TPA: hypothetical protein PLQ81_08905, partial [bacterium]|nr:hypothetical protein [bacterium]
EQNMAGGGQDNQAIDAKRIFMLKETADENLLKKKFNIEKILYVIIYDTYSEIRTGRHWEAIYSDVKEPNNTSKYVVNSVIFKELIENIK